MSGAGEDNRGGSCTIGVKAPPCDLCKVRARSICADLDAREFSRIEKTMARRNVGRGKTIMAEGEPNDQLCMIVSGGFRLSKMLEDGRRQVTGFLFPGDFLGVRSTHASAYTAEALIDSQVCMFPHAFLDDAATQAPAIKDRLIARGQTEYHKAQDHIVLLGKKSAEERVVSFIEMVDDLIGEDAGDGRRRVPLPMPRQDIADYLGLRLETLSRTLAALRKSGALAELGRHEVIFSR